MTHTFSRSRLPFMLACVSSFLALPSFAQEVPVTPPPQDASSQQPAQVGPTIKKESRLVLVDTVVTDKKGKYIHDLSKNDFRVFEDNKE